MLTPSLELEDTELEESELDSIDPEMDAEEAEIEQPVSDTAPRVRADHPMSLWILCMMKPAWRLEERERAGPNGSGGGKGVPGSQPPPDR